MTQQSLRCLDRRDAEHGAHLGNHDVPDMYPAAQPIDQPPCTVGVVKVMYCDVDQVVRHRGPLEGSQLNSSSR